MSDAVKKPTNCHFCGYLCGFLATVEDGRVTALEPDPTRYPYDEKITYGCRRWRENLGYLDDVRRINHPMKRKGKRGEGAWEQISWDDALDEIASCLSDLFERYGPQSLASAIGGPHGSFWPLHRFMNLAGSPNNMGIGQICWNPRIWMETLTYGWTIEADIRAGLTGVLVIWGSNPAESDNSAYWRSIQELSKSGMEIIVIDPRQTRTACIADTWMPINPKTDCILALSFINVIISEKLFDKDFIDSWCHGFDELEEHVKKYIPEYAQGLCGIDAKDIRDVAKRFARADAAVIVSGRGIDQSGNDVAATHRAICILRAITGNVDKPGACSLEQMSDFTWEVDMEMSSLFPEAQKKYCLNDGHTPLQTYDGYDFITDLTLKLGRKLPMRYMTSAHPDLLLKAILDKKPYPVCALIMEGTNPLLTYADTKRVFKALNELELVIALEQVMTPSAAMADYILPVAGAMERPVMQIHGGVSNMAYGGPAAISPQYERKSDYYVFRGLGQRLGQGEYWPDESLEEAFDRQLDAADISWEQFCRSGLYYREPGFYKHLIPDENGKPSGFATMTGKIELASESLQALGGERLPAPSMAFGENVSGKKGLTLITGARKQPYNASAMRNVKALRRSYPYPLLEISYNTAQALGLSDGDAAKVSTMNGSAEFMVKICPMKDWVASVDYGWWFPEIPCELPDLGGIFISNANLLTSCSLDDGEAMIGSWAYNGIDCEIEKIGGPDYFPVILGSIKENADAR
ncbi:MAG: molybdopterin-dependent oxidoreductase [Eggerthellaceae bacterium]|nr:molybdopterin-dependent oxidoreductase [Eggerthellaceae bacterium]